jgi:magnesium transporter
MSETPNDTLETPVEKCRQQVLRLVEDRRFSELRGFCQLWEPFQIARILSNLPDEMEAVVFRVLPKRTAAQVFDYLEVDDQMRLLHALGTKDVAGILDEMSPDDRTALLEELPSWIQQQLLALLDEDERNVARTLLGYPKGSVGRLMTPDYVSLRGGMTVAEALDYIRQHAPDSDTINMVYIVDERRRLVDGLRIRKLLLAQPDQKIAELSTQGCASLFAGDPAESAVEAFRGTDLHAIPVVTSTGKMVGIVTVDDVLDFAEDRATREMQKVGGSAELDDPYLETSVPRMLLKRGPWLVILFLGGMLTANAMAYFEGEIEKAIVLTIFLPLIIASGGNSGSQAATLIIRSMATGDLLLRDWAKVLRRELLTGFLLGLILGLIGWIRVAVEGAITGGFTEYWPQVGLAIGLSLVGVVLWGSLIGAMLPLILRRIGFDPATSSAPFVSTFVDVTGIVIYFTVAAWILKGTLL